MSDIKIIERYQKHFKDVDVTDWEIDDDTGSIAYVVLPYVNKTFVNHSDWYRYAKCIKWIEKNVEDEWFLDYEKPGMTFYFKKYNDALIFKLTWS